MKIRFYLSVMLFIVLLQSSAYATVVGSGYSELGGNEEVIVPPAPIVQEQEPKPVEKQEQKITNKKRKTTKEENRVNPAPSESATPSASPSATPSASPSATPSASPSATPSAGPSATPSASPSITSSASQEAAANPISYEKKEPVSQNSIKSFAICLFMGYFIMTIITLIYLLVMSPRLYIREFDYSTRYKGIGILYRSNRIYHVRFISNHIDTGDYMLLFRLRFSNKHYGEEIMIHLPGCDIRECVTQEVIFHFEDRN